MADYSHCVECGNRLSRTTIFCGAGGSPACSWTCHDRYLARQAPIAPRVDQAHCYEAFAAKDVQAASTVAQP